MWELYHRDTWALKNCCFWTVMEKTLESPLDCKESNPVNPKGNQPWIIVGRTDPEAPILRPPVAKNQLIWKDPDAGKDWSQEKGMIEDEMVGWHHRLNDYEFEQAPGVGEVQGSLVCCNHRVAESWTWLNDWTTTKTIRSIMGSLEVFNVCPFSVIFLYTFFLYKQFIFSFCCISLLYNCTVNSRSHIQNSFCKILHVHLI